MLPPTVDTLMSMAHHGSVADVLAAAASRTLAAVQPTFRRDGDRLLAVLPDGRTFTLRRMP